MMDDDDNYGQLQEDDDSDLALEQDDGKMRVLSLNTHTSKYIVIRQHSVFFFYINYTRATRPCHALMS